MTDDRFREQTTTYLRRLAARSAAVARMYEATPEEPPIDFGRDLLLEKEMSPVRGLVHKFTDRVLVLLTYQCAAYCRYCERQDRVGVSGPQARLGTGEIDAIARYVGQHPDVREIVFSGGDPLVHRDGLRYAARVLSDLPTVRVLRIHTRVPVQAPSAVDLPLMAELASFRPATYLSIHVNHVDELTDEARAVIQDLRRIGLLLISQSVILRTVNDSVEELERLFVALYQLGVRPYYLYHCQAIPPAERFVVPLEVERQLVSKLRERVSGIAMPLHVIDLPQAVGKVVVPEARWTPAPTAVADFQARVIKLADVDGMARDS